MLLFHKGDRIATTAGGERSASRPQSKALWELSPLTRGTDTEYTDGRTEIVHRSVQKARM